MDISNYLDDTFNRASENIKNNLERTLNEVKDAINSKLTEGNGKNLTENGNLSLDRNQISLFDKYMMENKIITQYRDKMLTERSKLIDSYAQKTAGKGTMYYIYDVHNKQDKTYLMSICEEGRGHEVIVVDEKDLPQGAGVDSMLRLKNGTYELDKEATIILKNKMQETFDSILQEQKEFQTAQRVENHVYKLMEVTDGCVSLIDLDKHKNAIILRGFEELEFPRELAKTAKEGDLFQYINGKYERYLEKK